MANDIAVLKLSEPISKGTNGVEYARLPPFGFEPPPGSPSTVAGWYVLAPISCTS